MKQIRGYQLLKLGGEWLGAARGYIQQRKCFGNGETITWGSNEEIRPPMTMKQVEELAAEAVAAALNDQSFLSKSGRG